LDDFANALLSAARIIRASCPTQTASTAPARLAVMQQRIEAMTKAVIALEAPLEKLYDLLGDEQKTRLNALAEDERKASAASGATEAPAQRCDAARLKNCSAPAPGPSTFWAMNASRRKTRSHRPTALVPWTKGWLTCSKRSIG
jgi:hypothetical protein